jgi:hypothetical protein
MTTNVIVRTDEDVLAVVGETDAGQLLRYCTSAAGVAKNVSALGATPHGRSSRSRLNLA